MSGSRFTIIILILVLLSQDYFAQLKSKIVYSDSEKLITRLEFEIRDIKHKNLGFADESNPGTPILDANTIFIAVPPGSKVDLHMANQLYQSYENLIPELNPNVKLINDTTLTYYDSEISNKCFTSDFYPASEVEICGYTWIRDFYCAVARINIQRYDWKQKRITELQSADLSVIFRDIKDYPHNSLIDDSFEDILSQVIINYKEAQNLRSFPNYNQTINSNDDWIDYSSNYVKLAVNVDGIYHITYDDLVAYGVPVSSLNPRMLKIFNKGEQLPIYVEGEDDLAFDESDYIEFWGTKNYGSSNYRGIVEQGEDYLSYMDRYTDTTFVWLAWSGENGLRTNQQDGSIVSTTDTLYNHKVILHLEDDVRLWYSDVENPRTQLPMWQGHKVFTWKYVDNGRSTNITFNTKDVFPNSNCNSIVRLISNAADVQLNAHSNSLTLNNTVGDTLNFNYLQTVNLQSTFPSSLLTNGQNTLKVNGINTAASFHRSMIDWVDIEYTRYNNAEGDSLYLIIPDGIEKAYKAVRIDNLNGNDYLLYKVQPEIKKITRFNLVQGAGNSIIFADTLEEGDSYFLISSSKIRQPEFVSQKQFNNLSSRSHSAEYIIIANKYLSNSTEHYRDFISSNYNLTTELVYVDDIYDEFSYGYFNPEAIKDFLIRAYQNWQSPKPVYLLLLGDANYDYKDIWSPAPDVRKRNLVPSYGYPVSDTWFVMWDEDETAVPQMHVGRIPANTNEDVEYYLSKHKKYLSKDYDDWNKTFMLFSGGNQNETILLPQIKAANDNIQHTLINPAPIGGISKHFYKTASPQTNYGLFTTNEFQNAIHKGAVIISYIGHSGTQTWDNGITTVQHLKNDYDNRYPLISDFGCSTGKFAEPDIDAFGELFIRDEDGQAIGYLGNASLGYTSTSLRFPQMFYEELLLGESKVLGKVHMLAKIKQFQDYGFTDVNRVFNYSNILFGDPIIEIKLPPKPNLVLKENEVELMEEQPNETMDSITVKIPYYNLGSVPTDSVTIQILANVNNSPFADYEKRVPCPLYNDSIFVKIPVLNLAGSHLLGIAIDPDNEIDELNEDDNRIFFTFTVYSISLRGTTHESFYNNYKPALRLLNPTQDLVNGFTNIKFEISTDPIFTNPMQISFPVDTFYTTISLENIQDVNRHWYRTKPDNDSALWGQTISFKKNNAQFNWYVDEPDTINQLVDFENIGYNYEASSWQLVEAERTLEIASAGQTAGSFVSVTYDGKEELLKTYFWGMTTMLIDSITYKPYDNRYFEFPSSTSAPALIDYISSLPNGTLIAMTICDDGAQSVLGFSSGTAVRKAIETCGSYYIDSVRYRESWCMLGKKGAAMGTVPESYKKLFEGSAAIKQTISTQVDSGLVTFPAVGPASKWDSLKVISNIPTGSIIGIIPYGVKTDGTIDTLTTIFNVNNSTSLNFIDARIYPEVKLTARFYANEMRVTPKLNSIGVAYTGVPELGTNYQVTWLEQDTLDQGEDANLSFYVYNVGETVADSFTVQVDIVNPDNTHEKIFEQFVDSLDVEQRKLFEVNYNTASFSGGRSFFINIDSGDDILELYEDNNFYTMPFYVVGDTTRPSLNLTFDGTDIMDGDYISPDPVIRIELSDDSLLGITDTSVVQMYLNNEPLYFTDNIETINYSFSDANPKFTVEYRPHLETGEYIFKVMASDAVGNLVDSAGTTKSFVVDNQTKLLYVYNYPNPFSDDTHFTFKLTQIPDELKIKVYTIAGRLIKEIKKISADLNFDFNRIYWDGRDEDGDLIANGVYLYKIIITKDGETQNVVQKLAVVR